MESLISPQALRAQPTGGRVVRRRRVTARRRFVIAALCVSLVLVALAGAFVVSGVLPAVAPG
jgi:hypothetical protein